MHWLTKVTDHLEWIKLTRNSWARTWSRQCLCTHFIIKYGIKNKAHHNIWQGIFHCPSSICLFLNSQGLLFWEVVFLSERINLLRAGLTGDRDFLYPQYRSSVTSVIICRWLGTLNFSPLPEMPILTTPVISLSTLDPFTPNYIADNHTVEIYIQRK